MTSTLPKRPALPTIPEILDKVSDVTDNITARLPEVKLPTVDIGRLPGADAVRRIPSLFSIDLTNLDVRKIADSPVASVAKRAAEEVKEVAYTAVGFGVLAVQKAQVRRREFFESRRTDESASTTVASGAASAKTSAKPSAKTTSQSAVRDTASAPAPAPASTQAQPQAKAQSQDIATSNTEPEPA